MDKNDIIFGVGMSSSVQIENKGKNILILGIGPTWGLDDIVLTAEAQYLINIWRSYRKFCLSLHYNGSKSLLFVNATKIYHFKTKDPKTKKTFLSFCYVCVSE